MTLLLFDKRIISTRTYEFRVSEFNLAGAMADEVR